LARPPALRIVHLLGVAHVARVAGAAPLGHTLAALNQGLVALGANMRRRGFASWGFSPSW
jgi:hypothetical protein